MGLFGKRTRLRPGDPSTWQMGQDGFVQGDTAVTKEDVPGYWQGGDQFGGRDALAAALAAVSDAFAQRGGSQNGSVGMLMGNRSTIMDRAQEAQAAQQARAEGLQDYEAKQQIDQRYAEPPKPDQLTQYMINAGIDPNSEQARKMFGQAVQNKVNPPVWRQGQDGQFYRVDTAEPPAITDDDWNSGQPLGAGGGVGNGTSGFPPRFRR